MATNKTLHDLFLDRLKDLYLAAEHILKALPEMAPEAQSEEGKVSFLQHREETHAQIERLEQALESAALDAGLRSSAQAVEHCGIARYGTLIEWAEQLGLTEAVALLNANLQEEVATDEKLTALAGAQANENATKAA